jgi:hypothetical protein
VYPHTETKPEPKTENSRENRSSSFLHTTSIERELGTESSRENRSSLFLHTKTIEQEELGTECSQENRSLSFLHSKNNKRELGEEQVKKHAAAKDQAQSIIKWSVRIRTKHQWNQADQICRLLPRNEERTKPAPEHHQGVGQASRKAQREPRAQMQSNREPRTKKKI